MIYNIAVFGSCASRDNFYSGINPDYKKYFNCSISSQRGSIISLMQEPVPFKNQDIQILPENRVNKAGTQDLTKNFLAEVKKFKPDYILIDNYFEVIFGIIKYENCFITNNYWDLPKTKFHTEIKPYTKINMYNNPNTYLKLYKENMDLFLDYIQKESSNSQIILNPVRLGYKILKDDNKIENSVRDTFAPALISKGYSLNDTDENHLREALDILKKQKDVITLKIKKERILDENHEWGLGQVHYTQPYYLNILNQLKQISKNDKSLLSKIYELF